MSKIWKTDSKKMNNTTVFFSISVTFSQNDSCKKYPLCTIIIYAHHTNINQTEKQVTVLGSVEVRGLTLKSLNTFGAICVNAYYSIIIIHLLLIIIIIILFSFSFDIWGGHFERQTQQFLHSGEFLMNQFFAFSASICGGNQHTTFFCAALN